MSYAPPADVVAPLPWKPDWPAARENWLKFWRRDGLAFLVTAPADEPWLDVAEPPRPDDPEIYWMDPEYRARQAEWKLANTFWGGEGIPHFATQFGPGSLANYLGSQPGFSYSTVWYHPCIDDPDTYGDIVFDPANEWFKKQLAIIDRGLDVAQGRYFLAMPDMIENIDILAAMRDPQTLMMDMIERPAWVEKCIWQINDAYRAVFDALHARLAVPGGGNMWSAFSFWGPGRAAKVQCDASAMFSPDMFKQFVVPAMTDLCAWLDCSVYHLDGPEAMCHLDHLLAMEPLNVVQWTPGARNAPSGSAAWHELYRRILAAGKGVQTGCAFDNVVPLLDATGGKGMMITVSAPNETAARQLLDRVEAYR